MKIPTQLPDWFPFDKYFLKPKSLSFNQKVKKNMNQFGEGTWDYPDFFKEE